MNKENQIKPVAIHKPLMENLIRQKKNYNVWLDIGFEFISLNGFNVTFKIN